MQSIDKIETYAYKINTDLMCKKEEIKSNNKIKQNKNAKLWFYYKRRHKRT